MSDLNLKDLSLADLKKLAEKLEKEIPAKTEAAAKQAAAEVRKIMHALDVSFDVLVAELKKPTPSSTKKKRSKKKATRKKTAAKKVAPKYRNPANPEQTWAGRGRKPKWLEEEVAKGKKVEDFAIKD